MKARDAFELVLLAAVWGASFLFMRVLAPLLGPFVTADLRMLIGALFLSVVFVVAHKNPQFKGNTKTFLIIGMVNSALPFTLFSLAALSLPASVAVVLNALSPVFGTLAGVAFLGEKVTVPKALGLALGVAGVVVVAGGLDLGVDSGRWWALGACILAPLCYAMAGILVKKRASGIAPASLAMGSQLWAGLVMLPTWGLGHLAPLGDPLVLVLVAAFGILCSGLAYLWYYGLMQRIGPTKTLTVTFLMPAFGVLWGVVFLGESLTPALVGGAVLIVVGTGLVTLLKRH